MSERAGRGRLTERAYAYVREGILDGSIPVGTLLVEEEIAAAIGSSRTPVRHALSQLLQEGLLQVGHRRQLTVRGFTPEHRAEILVLRQALEGVSVRRACELMSVEAIDQLHLNLRRQQRAASDGLEDDFIDLDEQFHLAIAAGAGLPLLERFLRQLREFVRVARLGTRRPAEVLVQVAAEHETILRAIEARDADAAFAALMHHLTHSAYEYSEPVPVPDVSQELEA
ncbi:MAG TPA: GntR family transcriptional regulator [Gaiellaceae bacterium]|jgi:DNA-binding GntR family transcriptional regulator|nr:GntR family transcriptional regulator [Gaiellaceae bacterium]